MTGTTWKFRPGKPTLRVTLTTLFLTLILLTVASLGFSSYRNARFTAADLSAQIIDQNSRLIDDQINDLLHTADEQCRLNLRLLQSGQFDPADFAGLARYWREVMAVHPRLTRMSIALEATGEWSYVHRRADASPVVGELRRDPSTGELALTEWLAADYPGRSYSSDPNRGDRDPRALPWYVEAKRTRRQAWSDTYILIGAEGAADVPAVTCATPVPAADGSLRGVLSASFDVIELGAYLRGLRVGESGSAFVVEFRDDGERRVIAHPDEKILIRDVPGPGGAERREFVPIDELADRRVAEFLRQIPPGDDPARFRRTTHIRFAHDGVPYLGAYRCLSTAETPDWLIAILLPEGDVLARVGQSNREALLIGLAILMVATAVSLAISTQIARPLERIAGETEAIGRLRVEARPVAHSIVREVDRLAVAVEATKTSLRSFGKYVPADLVRLLVATGQEATPGGERRRMTIYFCDLADFTSMAESLPPEDLVRHMGEYFERLSADIVAAGGTVDKYIGDAIMAFWGAPAPTTNHATAACSAALTGRASMADLRRRWASQGKARLFTRIGIHTGEVVVGNVGSPARLNYTVMGDAVNVASRLEGMNKFYGTDILIGDPTRREAAAAVLARPVDWVSVKGKAEGLLVHEPLGGRDSAPDGSRALAEMAAAALDLYRVRDWDGAIRLFDEIGRLRPGDGPGRVLGDRCRALRAAPPPESWDGVHRMVDK